jgi:hypothetical protein
MNEEKHRWWKAPVQFLAEALAATLSFLVIAAAAISLSFLVHYLEKIDVDIVIVAGLTLAEYLLFLADLTLFFRFVWKTVYRNWSKM